MGFNNFEIVKLTGIGTLARGKSKHRPRYDPVLYGGKYPFIQTGDIRKAGKRIKDFEQSYSEVGLSQSKLWEKDTLCITIAANIAETSILDFEACFPDSVVGFIPDTSRCSIDYIYYYFQYFKKEIQSRAYGSVQENINLKVLNDIDIILPPLHIQNKITSILSPLDEKIEVNNKVIQNLEELAQTFFKRWFIDFEFPDENGKPYKSSGGKMVESELGSIPNGWEIGTLNNICEVNKHNISSKDKWEYVNYLDTANITENYIDNIQKLYADKDKIPSRAKRIVKENDIVYSTVRPNQHHYGIIKDPMENMVVSTGFAVLTSKTIYSTEFIYLWLTQKGISQKLQSIAEQSTSAYPSIKPIDIISIKLLIPSDKELINFSNIIRSQFDLMWKVQQQNQVLSQIRDTLLPKLFSGEIELPVETEVTEHVPIP